MEEVIAKLEDAARLLDRALGDRFDERVYKAGRIVGECIEELGEHEASDEA